MNWRGGFLVSFVHEYLVWLLTGEETETWRVSVLNLISENRSEVDQWHVVQPVSWGTEQITASSLIKMISCLILLSLSGRVANNSVLPVLWESKLTWLALTWLAVAYRQSSFAWSWASLIFPVVLLGIFFINLCKRDLVLQPSATCWAPDSSSLSQKGNYILQSHQTDCQWMLGLPPRATSKSHSLWNILYYTLNISCFFPRLDGRKCDRSSQHTFFFICRISGV